ncbi:MAG TPA: TetR family transcriptional regulator [Mariniphaga anaerophila]|uniref:TetR family transcriptional regulator n=1 Tax=Mariniphaga anaerophila TaxID=1484053 RepID=A0A831LS71_9BACT|nr:TetR family transcriptional regulator [Mariniphaga anaerophila]
MHTERQQEIIETALGLINEKGIQGLTIKNLSKRLGITEPAIYRHFENKIQILIALLDLLKKNTSVIFEAELNSDETAVLKVARLFEKHFKSFAEMPSLASVVFSEEIFRNEEKLISKISEVIEHNNKTLLAILTEGQRNNEIRNDIDAEHLVIFIMGALRLFVKKWQFSGFAFNLEKEGAKLIESVKRLISK